MGAYAAHSVRGVGISQGSLPACMIEAGISPQQDAFLMSLCQAYRTFALKNVQVCLLALLRPWVSLQSLRTACLCKSVSAGQVMQLAIEQRRPS